MKTSEIARVFASFALVGGLFAGCGTFNTSSLLGRSMQELTAPYNAPVATTYETASAGRTIGIPVEYVKPEVGYLSTVTKDTLGTPVVVGTFKGGEIVAREFEKVCAANFKKPEGDERPVAKFSVKLMGIVAKKPMMSSIVNCQVRVRVDLIKGDTGEVGYSKEFVSAQDSEWKDATTIPTSFYVALNNDISSFLKDWESGTALANLLKWAGEAGPKIVPPELRSLDFAQAGNGVLRGECSVACNGYEGFQTKGWATTQIAAACRTKLGIEPERVRVIYDREDFDANAKTWTFEFQTFARTEKVLIFDKVTRHGSVTGDLGLMGLSADAAAEVLKNYVLTEMDSHAGVVSSGGEGAKAQIRFDDFTTDGTYNLITIRFRLVY